MSDNDSVASRSGTPPVTPVKKVQKANGKGKGRGKREVSPDEYAPSDVAVGSEDDDDQQADDEAVKAKNKKGAAPKGGTKNASPAKKSKSNTGGGSSPGKGTWTVRHSIIVSASAWCRC